MKVIINKETGDVVNYNLDGTFIEVRIPQLYPNNFKLENLKGVKDDLSKYDLIEVELKPKNK